MERRLFIRGITFSSFALTTSSLLAGNFSKGDKAIEKKSKKHSKNKPLNKMEKILGLGGVPLAGGWKKTSEEDALKTIEESWDLGIRYFDTSPRYGNGISERRFGVFLDGKDPDEYILSSKIGRILKPGVAPEDQIGHLWKNPMNAVFHYDYSAEGARKSVEDSLLRLGVLSLDYVFIHDLTPENLEDEYEKYFEQAKNGAIPELEKMKKEGIIKGWGFGINQPDAVLSALEFSKPDICLMATQYSLIDHSDALLNTFPKLEENGVKVVIGSPLNCGYLAGNETWNYTGEPAPEPIAKKRKELQKVAKKHNVDLRTAALQFCMAHPIVVSVVTGCRNPKQISENFESLHGNVKIPKAFWKELKEKSLIEKTAPIPRM